MRKEGEVSGCDLVPPAVHWSGEETHCDLFRTLLTPPSLLPRREGGGVVPLDQGTPYSIGGPSSRTRSRVLLID
jgi:hypothetical protein